MQDDLRTHIQSTNHDRHTHIKNVISKCLAECVSNQLDTITHSAIKMLHVNRKCDKASSFKKSEYLKSWSLWR